MDIFESLEELNVSEECFDDIVSMTEAMINEYIKQGKMNQLADVQVRRRVQAKRALEGEAKDAAQKKLNRNIELTDNYIERHGSPLQRAISRKYSKNATEKKALLKAGFALKDDPIVSGRSNIVKY